MIGLTTIHHANSYGGLLQTYATVQRLRNYGEVRVLDYRKSALSDGLRPIRWAAREPKDILRVGKDILRYPSRSTLVRKFNSFIHRNFPLTPSFSDPVGAAQIVEQCRITHLVAGSDQIWNPTITGGLDPVFTLSFSKGARKSSLSSSAGSFCYAGHAAELLKRSLEEFDSIAVREPDFADYIRTLLPDREVMVTLDPTLLLEENHWVNLATSPSRAPSSGYVLTYTLGSPPGFQELVEATRRRYPAPVVAINQDPFLGHKADFHLKDAGPDEFLSLFRNATAVVTNSFHGVAFSIIFGKPFLVCPPSSGVNRISGLLERLGISNRIQNSGPVAAAVDSDIDYATVRSNLARLREDSDRYLVKAFSK